MIQKNSNFEVDFSKTYLNLLLRCISYINFVYFQVILKTQKCILKTKTRTFEDIQKVIHKCTWIKFNFSHRHSKILGYFDYFNADVCYYAEGLIVMLKSRTVFGVDLKACSVYGRHEKSKDEYKAKCHLKETLFSPNPRHVLLGSKALILIISEYQVQTPEIHSNKLHSLDHIFSILCHN